MILSETTISFQNHCYLGSDFHLLDLYFLHFIKDTPEYLFNLRQDQYKK